MTRGRTLLIILGQGSKVKVTSCTLLFNLVNTIQTKPFKLGPSNFVHILLIPRGRTLLIFKVRGQRSRSHTKVDKSCQQGKTLLYCQLWHYFPHKFTSRAYFATVALLLSMIVCFGDTLALQQQLNYCILYPKVDILFRLWTSHKSTSWSIAFNYWPKFKFGYRLHNQLTQL